MAEILRLRSNKAAESSSPAFKQQLRLPLDSRVFAGNLVCCFEENIQPYNILNIISSEGIGCVADLRRVPFFSGEKHRHKKISTELTSRNIPVFHVGSAYFTTVDQSLPPTLKRAYLHDLLESTDSIRDTIDEYLNNGACLLVIDGDPEVLMFAKMLVDIIVRKFNISKIKINGAWSNVINHIY